MDESGNSGRPAILIVDAEASCRLTLSDMLEARGYDCVGVETVREALDTARQTRPDLCLLDLKLPDGTGLDLLARLREVSPGTETVVLTGCASLETAIRALDLGAFRYLEKPHSSDRLFLTLEKALERRRLLRAVHQSRTAYQRLLSATGALVFSADPVTWRIAHPNPAFMKALGYGPDRCPNLRLNSLIPESEMAPIKQALGGPTGRIPTPGPSMSLDLPLLRADGSIGWFSASVFRLSRLDLGPAAGAGDTGIDADTGLVTTIPAAAGFDLLFICSDTSLARYAISSLERTRDFFSKVFTALPCGVMIVDADYRIIDCNPSSARTVERSCQSLTGLLCHEVLSLHQSPCSMFGEVCPITVVRTTGHAGRVVRELRLPDGRIRRIDYSASPLVDALGATSGFVIVMNPVTDLRVSGPRIRKRSEAIPARKSHSGRQRIASASAPVRSRRAD